MKAKKIVDTKPKKPNYKKTETFQDYKSAAATFADYNPGTDTVFVGASIDPGMAHKKANRNQSISYSKGASGPYSDDQKMYKTTNEAGQTVYVAMNKTKKKEYSKGGIMKAKKKYSKGGPIDAALRAELKKKTTKKTKKNFPILELGLAYLEDGTPKVSDCSRVSKSSRRVYKGVKDIKKSYGLTVLSTPKGILSDREAREQNVGGEVLFKIW